jgi:2-polyprenyl-6-hydroxyphenyl methylase/3-demethylubiquinone-9 3-methyltransferase
MIGRVRRWIDRSAANRRVARLAAILADDRPTETLGPAEFRLLQERFPVRPDYGYDVVSTWRRASQRMEELLERVERLRTPGARVLEVGCGDGMLGVLLATYGHEVALSDLEDWRETRARALDFVAADATRGLPYADEAFDVVVSYNSFEHILDPPAALAAMCRVLRPGGVMHFHFGPLYWSAWGLHAYRQLRMPWPQILFAEDFVLDRLRETGIRDLGRERAELQPLNRWRPAQYAALWRDAGLEVLDDRPGRREEFLHLVEEFPQCFRGRGLSLDDITIQALRVTLRRVPAAGP